MKKLFVAVALAGMIGSVSAAPVFALNGKTSVLILKGDHKGKKSTKTCTCGDKCDGKCSKDCKGKCSKDSKDKKTEDTKTTPKQ